MGISEGAVASLEPMSEGAMGGVVGSPLPSAPWQAAQVLKAALPRASWASSGGAARDVGAARARAAKSGRESRRERFMERG